MELLSGKNVCFEIGEQIRNKLPQRAFIQISNIILNKYKENFGQFFIFTVFVGRSNLIE
jgi:hypothetical protein